MQLRTYGAMAVVWLGLPMAARPAITISVRPETGVVARTGEAEFDLGSSGYLRGRLLKNGRAVTLDEPSESSEALISGGEAVRFPAPDFRGAKVTDVRGGLGARGKRIELRARQGVFEKTLRLEFYDDFSRVAFATVTYRNAGAQAVKIDRVVLARRRLNAGLAEPQAAPFQMWSFSGSSYAQPQFDLALLKKGFTQANPVGPSTYNGFGGGFPVLAFWTKAAGVAIGHTETRVRVLSMPIEVGEDGRVGASIRIEPEATLKPGESYTAPRTFLTVFSGDFYEPVSTWSAILQRQGWAPATPTNESFEANWCGYGYQNTVTPDLMTGTIPKLKELGFKWATLDAGWYNNHGDWDPQPEKFPGDSLRRMVDEFHRNGIRITAWWLPLGAADGQGKSRRPPAFSKVAAEHPEWIILDAKGERGRIQDMGALAALCPAVPGVQDYYRRITEKLMRDFDFDGSKIDYSYAVPRCFNPAHHHKSPDESVEAVADVYRIIFETSRKLKPYAVTQICPCGTTPNAAWLPYMDQAVTADPVGSVQVRRRIKLYKAILGPGAAIYGDHVELSGPRSDDYGVQLKNRDDPALVFGQDFAATVGTGGVLGTKFTWPDVAPRLERVYLTPQKEQHWRKWIGIYNSLMLAKGTFLNLYTIGYDAPEGYAIAKGGKMYYAFFAPLAAPAWTGELELRGLKPGRYRVLDYENQRSLGTVEGARGALRVEFKDHLLLEVEKQ